MATQKNKPEAEIRVFPHSATPDAARQDVHPESAEAPTKPVAETPIAPPVAAKKKGSLRAKLIRGVVFLAILGGAGWYGYNWWIDGRFMVSTDDSYVTADIVTLSPKVTGYVRELLVSDNAHVKKGDALMVIDDGDYKIAVDLARAQLAVQQKTLLRLAAQAEAGRAELLEAEASKAASQSTLDNSVIARDRAEKLRATNIAPQSTLDDAKAAFMQAKAGLAGSDAKIAAANANITVLDAEYAEAEASVKTLELDLQKAERDLSFTTLRASADGVVGNMSAEVGNLVSVGQKLGSLVPLDDVYVEANFKETDLPKIAVGEKVRIKIDAIGEETFEGTVASLAPATGSVFSMLPPENATGNFTKVVQRLPIRIKIGDELLKSGKLHAGLSATISVDTRTKPQ